jgi:hypothetical protein
MMVLPNTNTATKGMVRRWPLYALVAVALAALALGVESFLRTENFSPGETINSPGIRDVTVSTEDGLYPPPDTNHFEEQPGTIFVYLSVEGLPTGEDMEARVQRAESGSAFSLLFGGESRLEALDEQEDHLSNGENGATGIVKFALRTRSGEPVPPGNYTVDVVLYGSSPPGSGEEETVAARKFFVVEG